MPPDPFLDYLGPTNAARTRLLRAAAKPRHHAHHMPMAPMERVGEFHEAIKAGHLADLDATGRAALLERRQRLITEEYHEVLAEFDAQRDGRGDLAAMAKELADLLVVVFGTAEVLAIPLEAVFVAVMESNMTKVADPVYDAGGKVLKGAGYVPPDITAILDS